MGDVAAAVKQWPCHFLGFEAWSKIEAHYLLHGHIASASAPTPDKHPPSAL